MCFCGVFSDRGGLGLSLYLAEPPAALEALEGVGCPRPGSGAAGISGATHGAWVWEDSRPLGLK